MKKNIILSLLFIFLFYYECSSVKNNASVPHPAEKKDNLERMRILVSPFENTGDVKFSWISSGMTDTVISDLARYHDISVITDEDRRKAFKEIASGQKGTIKDTTISQAGKMTGANLILRGSYLVQGDSIRVNARIVQIESGTSSKPVKIDGTIKEIFDLQDKIVTTLLEDSENITHLKIDKAVVDKNNLLDRPNIEAFELYSKGKELEDSNPTQALAYYKKAIQLSPEYIVALKSAGSAAWTFNHFSDSLEYYDKALKILQKRKEANKNEYANLVRLVGQVYFSIGDLDKAIDFLHTSKKIYDRLNLQSSDSYAELMNGFGFVYDEKGDFDKSLEYYNKSREIYESLKMHTTKHYATIMMNTGNIYLQKEDRDKALEYYNKSKEVYDNLSMENTNSYAMVMLNIGVVYDDKAEFDTALGYYIKSKEIFINLQLQNTDAYTRAINNIGGIYSSKNEFDTALEYYNKSKEIKDNLKLQNTVDYAKMMLNIGSIYKGKGNKQQARFYYEKAKRIYKKNGRTNDIKGVEALMNEL